MVLDTVEALFAGLSNEMLLRSELRRLFRYLKDIGVTALITGERGEGTLTRHGIEEYVSDAVILLDQRIQEQIATRRLRIVKYRGSRHGADEYPFLITPQGFSILPVTSLGLDYAVSTERVSSGISRLDTMLGGEGYYRGRSILVSGTAGTGKSSLASLFADAACQRGERVLYLAMEESQDQVIRNMLSIGLNLSPWVEQDLLRFHAARPTLCGLEMHLAIMHNLVNEFQPAVIVMDPITNLATVATQAEVKSVLMRLVDFFKNKKITTLFTNLAHPGETEITESGVSSLMDTWILLSNPEFQGERNRNLFILKSRGMAHSNQVREFLITDQGLELMDVYLGAGGVLTGAARVQQESRERAQQAAAALELERRQRLLEQKRKSLEAQIAALEVELAGEEADLNFFKSQEARRQEVESADRRRLAAWRPSDKTEPGKGE